MASDVLPRRPGSTADGVFALLVGGWIVFTTVIIQVVTWAVEQLTLIEGLAMPAWGWPLAVWINAIVAGTPAILLATLGTRPTTRATGLAWSLATLTLGVAGSLRAIPAQQSEIYFAALAVLATAWAGGLVLIGRRQAAPLSGTVAQDPGNSTEVAGSATQDPRNSTEVAVLLVSLAAGIAVVVPWLWVGALGGVTETALAILAAAACGALAATVLQPIWSTFARTPTTRRTLLVAGLAAGVALVPLGAAYGGSGPHLAQILMLPPLGIVAAALYAFDRRTGRARVGAVAIAGLIGLAALGPLAFVEPDETSIVLGFHDVGYWTAIGGLCSWAIGTVLAIAGLIATRRTGVRTTTGWRRFAAPIALATAAATAIVVYPLAGHPGFFGESLFVVMKQQASLAGLAAIPDRDQRLRATYQRLIATAEATQAPLRAELRRDGIKFTPYYLVNGIEVDDDVQARIWLSTRADVDRVLLNPRLRPIPSKGPADHGNLPAPDGPVWNIDLVDAPAVWAGGDTGQGIVIGGSDTGVDLQHPALAASYRGGGDSWYDPWNHTTSPVDHMGHGTHTMGSALGAGGIGVAPGAQWMACVNLDRNMGNPAYYLDCLQFMLAPFAPGGDAFHGDPTRAADVLTNSWGCPTVEGCDLDALEPAVDALTAAGIFFVAAAGNEGPRCGSIDDAPAPYAATFTVGAVDRNRKIADFSSRGPVVGESKPDIVAPGVDILSALPGGGYGTLDGTSMATPQVAGVVALMWTASPALRGNVPLTAQILRETAGPAEPDSRADCGGARQVGAGLVNAEAAVTAARAITG
jgi:subtilase family protein